MSLHLFQGVLFDMDGVLINSNSEIENFWRTQATGAGFSISDEDIVEHIHGRTTRDTLSSLFRRLNEPAQQNIYEAALAFDIEMQPDLLPGAEDFLKQLKATISKIAVVTSAPLPRAKQMLGRHDVFSLFAASVTGDEVKQGKPHPEPYLLVAHKLGVTPADCLVFEDSDSGIESALAAGMSVIAVNNARKDSHIIAQIKDYHELAVEDGQLIIRNERSPYGFTK